MTHVQIILVSLQHRNSVGAIVQLTHRIGHLIKRQNISIFVEQVNTVVIADFD